MPQQNEYPALYLFYGTFADPLKLKRLLHLDFELNLAPAEIRRGKVMMQSMHRALMDGGEGNRVQESMECAE